MLRLNKLTDYGFVLLTHLASRETGSGSASASNASGANARELAADARLPLPTVTKLLKMLTSAGLLESHRGTKGGYTLSRPASQITVAEALAALEGPVSLTECSQPGLCAHEHGCPTRGNWQIINRTVLDALSRLTLAEMTRPMSPPRLSCRPPPPAFRRRRRRGALRKRTIP
jgi:FeS assembly SUF system regulator